MDIYVGVCCRFTSNFGWVEVRLFINDRNDFSTRNLPMTDERKMNVFSQILYGSVVGNRLFV